MLKVIRSIIPMTFRLSQFIFILVVVISVKIEKVFSHQTSYDNIINVITMKFYWTVVIKVTVES